MKTFKILTLIFILSLIVACGNKVSFKKKEPLKDAALVYVYVPESITSGEGDDTYTYSIRINNKRYQKRITEGEYLAFDLKPLKVDISATRSQIEEHKLSIVLEAGHIYYFKIQKQDDSTFTFERVKADLALKEIVKTGLAGSMVEDESNIITEFVNPKKDKKEDVMVTKIQPAIVPQAQATAPAKKSTSSKLDEIKEAYQMKKDGLISDEEFKTIKAQILAR